MGGERGPSWQQVQVGGFYSRFKRQFGEYVFSKKSEDIEREIVIKTIVE